jgi:hypothetical protein
MASLSPMPLTDFCNQRQSPGTPIDDSTPTRKQSPCHARLPSRDCEQQEHETEVPKRRSEDRLSCRPGTSESACTQRCRGQLERTRTPHRHHLLVPSLERSTVRRRSRLSAEPVARTTATHGRTEVPSTDREPRKGSLGETELPTRRLNRWEETRFLPGPSTRY